MKIGNINVRPFVMIVPEFTEKTVAIQKHLREVGIEAEEFPCVCAYDALVAPAEPVSGLTTMHTYEVDAPGSGYRIGPKGTALCVSFQMFWTMCMFLPDDFFFFIEWDALFQTGWSGPIRPCWTSQITSISCSSGRVAARTNRRSTSRVIFSRSSIPCAITLRSSPRRLWAPCFGPRGGFTPRRTSRWPSTLSLI
jgi:hypothetical protein